MLQADSPDAGVGSKALLCTQDIFAAAAAAVVPSPLPLPLPPPLLPLLPLLLRTFAASFDLSQAGAVRNGREVELLPCRLFICHWQTHWLTGLYVSKLPVLPSTSRPQVRAIRNGREVELPVRDVLVGDLLLVETGDILCTDGILVAGCDVK